MKEEKILLAIVDDHQIVIDGLKYFFPLLVFANFGIKIATTIRRRRLVF